MPPGGLRLPSWTVSGSFLFMPVRAFCSEHVRLLGVLLVSCLCPHMQSPDRWVEITSAKFTVRAPNAVDRGFLGMSRSSLPLTSVLPSSSQNREERGGGGGAGSSRV